MPITNFPYGFKEGVSIRGIPLTLSHPGRVFWLGNANVAYPGRKSASNGNDGSFLAPFATLTYALTKCTASRGDIIMVLPGHAENFATAGAIDANVAGVAIVGLGTGSMRPKFSATAAAATFVISAANMSFVNIEWQANFADVTMMLDVSAVDGLSFVNCRFTEAGTDLNFVDCIDLATGCDDISFVGCKFIGNDAANDSFITGVAHDGFYMSDCYLAMNTAQAAVVGLIESSGNVTNMLIERCQFRSNVDGALFLDFNGAANGGLIVGCNFSSIDTAGAVTAGFDVTGAHVFDCLVAGEADSYGIVGGGTAYNNA